MEQNSIALSIEMKLFSLRWVLDRSSKVHAFLMIILSSFLFSRASFQSLGVAFFIPFRSLVLLPFFSLSLFVFVPAGWDQGISGMCVGYVSVVCFCRVLLVFDWLFCVFVFAVAAICHLLFAYPPFCVSWCGDVCLSEKRKLKIPSSLGYGDRGSPPKIPGMLAHWFRAHVSNVISPAACFFGVSLTVFLLIWLSWLSPLFNVLLLHVLSCSPLPACHLVVCSLSFLLLLLLLLLHTSSLLWLIDRLWVCLCACLEWLLLVVGGADLIFTTELIDIIDSKPSKQKEAEEF